MPSGCLYGLFRIVWHEFDYWLFLWCCVIYYIIYHILNKKSKQAATYSKEREVFAEQLCEDNPEYFYNILPYAYVLGVSDVWIKKFEHIAIPQVEWYATSSSTNSEIFSSYSTRRLFSTISHAATPVVKSSSSLSGGGGFSGGGFSGGGSGGGGGGSW